MQNRRNIVIIIILIATLLIYNNYDSIVAKLNDIKANGFKFANLSQPANTTSPERIKSTVVDEEDGVINTVEKASPAVVSIVRREVTFDFFNGPTRNEDSIGTGFIIDGKDWIVLTNKHVVNDDGAQYKVILNNEEEHNVQEVYLDPLNDFAILKIDKSDSQGKVLPELSLGDSDKLKVGQSVVAIGNALGEFGNSVTKGVVSGLRRGIVARGPLSSGAESLDNVIQTDAALNPGNSGGPLLNLNAEVVGINVAISQGAQNLGFALPINSIKSVIDQFKKEGRIIRPFLGVEYMQITKDVSEQRAIPVGAFIRTVVKGSPADNAGIKVGDIIIKINNIRLDDKDNSLAKIISKLEVGKEIDVVLDRDGREQTVRVKLEDANQKQ